MARVILRSRHVTRDGERETNGGKRKGERKEDNGGAGERSALARSGTANGGGGGGSGTRKRGFETEEKSHQREIGRIAQSGRERSEKNARETRRRKGAVTFGRSTGRREMTTMMREKEIDKEREAGRRISSLRSGSGNAR